MLLFRKLMSVRRADAKLPAQVRAALVASLYGPVASLVAGAISGGIIGAMVSVRADNLWLTSCSVTIFLCGLARVGSAVVYHRAERSDPHATRYWERIYTLGAWSYSALLGLQCVLALLLTDDPAVHLVVATMSTGYAAGITGRNAGRAYVAIGQLTLAVLPLSLALIIHGGWIHVGLGLVLLLFIYAMVDITLSIREIIVQALVTNRDKAELADLYEEQAKQFDAALTNMSHGLCMFDRDNRLAVWNERFLEVTGLPAARVRAGASVHELVRLSVQSGNHSGAIARRAVGTLARQLAAGQSGQTEAGLADGRTISLSQRPMPAGGSVVIFEDITARKQAERAVARMARFDELTGLANRTTFHERMEDALAAVRMRSGKAAVHWIDLDRFKAVNDTLGHPVGDGLLRGVAERLQTAVRDSDVVARFGGDEFVILQSPIRKTDDAARLARRVMEALGAPFLLEGHQIDIGASIGIALAPRDGVDADRLLKSADLALYRAKGEGRGAFRFFEVDMDEGAQARRALELDLRKAWERGEFDIHYQPLVDLASERIVGCEALVRWHHPTRGLVSPAEFIPIAEETGLIIPLGEWVLHQACTEATRWPGHVRLAVNLSPVQFKGRTLASTVVATLARSGLMASRLELEVTEMVLLHESTLTVSTMAQLRQLGVRLSLDDFGTGYSSLSYLRKFPFQKIKLDRSFVKDLGRDAGSAAIVRAVSSLGGDLGMTILVEGIETQEQLERVRAEGCTEGQGYLFGRPMPAPEIRGVLGEGVVRRLRVA
jgi:diguanylate cyclase (GGDEF)-like protein/PAS domain S-box-containing protein